MKNSRMELFTKEPILRENLKAMGSTTGIMERAMKENGQMEWKMGQEYGEVPKAIPTLANGKMERLLDMVCIHGSMVIGTKANSWIVWSMDKGYRSLLMETTIKVCMKVENLQVMVNITGQWEASLKAIFRMDWEMAMVCGKEVLEIQTNTKDNIRKIRRKDMEFFHGRMEIFTKEISWTIKGMAMEKCTGTMVPFSRVNGNMAYNSDKVQFTIIIVQSPQQE